MSFWIAFGRIRSSTNWRTVSCSRRCSSLSSKSIAAYPTGLVVLPALATAVAVALLTPQEKAALVVVSGQPAPVRVGGVLVQPATRAAARPWGSLVFADQEGGRVRAFRTLPPFRAASAYTSEDEAFAAGRATGHALRRIGVDVDLAPVLDLRDGPLGSRQFDDSSFALAFARGLGAHACVKHFPGLGSLA